MQDIRDLVHEYDPYLCSYINDYKPAQEYLDMIQREIDDDGGVRIDPIRSMIFCEFDARQTDDDLVKEVEHELCKHARQLLAKTLPREHADALCKMLSSGGYGAAFLFAGSAKVTYTDGFDHLWNNAHPDQRPIYFDVDCP